MKYYLVSSSGSALFTLPYPEDFCYHCLHLLIDNPLYSDFYLVPELAYTAGFFLLSRSSTSNCFSKSAMALEAVDRVNPSALAALAKVPAVSIAANSAQGSAIFFIKLK